LYQRLTDAATAVGRDGAMRGRPRYGHARFAAVARVSHDLRGGVEGGEAVTVHAVLQPERNSMRKIVEEVSGEGLEKLLGERVTLFCLNYIYTGKLMGVNSSCVLLEDASIVYETGALNDKKWKDAQSLPQSWYVQIGAIESFGILKV
jgi:hypothetical protein